MNLNIEAKHKIHINTNWFIVDKWINYDCLISRENVCARAAVAGAGENRVLCLSNWIENMYSTRENRLVKSRWNLTKKQKKHVEQHTCIYIHFRYLSPCIFQFTVARAPCTGKKASQPASQLASQQASSQNIRCTTRRCIFWIFYAKATTHRRIVFVPIFRNIRMLVLLFGLLFLCWICV